MLHQGKTTSSTRFARSAPPDRANADGASSLFELGMMCSAGQSEPVDLIAAHKWFNLAAMNGHPLAIRMRQEVAHEMTASEIAAAQRSARNWLARGGQSQGAVSANHA